MRFAWAAVGTVLGFAVGGTLMYLAEFKNAFLLLGGFGLLVLAPIVAAAYTAVSNKKPVVWNFDDDAVEIKFRNREYLDAYRD